MGRKGRTGPISQEDHTVNIKENAEVNMNGNDSGSKRPGDFWTDYSGDIPVTRNFRPERRIVPQNETQVFRPYSMDRYSLADHERKLAEVIDRLTLERNAAIAELDLSIQHSRIERMEAQLIAARNNAARLEERADNAARILDNLKPEFS